MTSKPSSLSEDQIATATKALSGKKCPVCGSAKLTIGEEAFLVAIRDQKVQTNYGLRVLPVSCSGCGHVMLFSSEHLGIVLDDQGSNEKND